MTDKQLKEIRRKTIMGEPFDTPKHVNPDTRLISSPSSRHSSEIKTRYFSKEEENEILMDDRKFLLPDSPEKEEFLKWLIERGELYDYKEWQNDNHRGGSNYYLGCCEVIREILKRII